MTQLPSISAIVLSGVSITGAAASAEDAATVHLDVAYLAAPTDWCPADKSVPMTVTMNGPDIIRGPEDFPRGVTVRRGSEVTYVDGEHTNSFARDEDFVGPNAEVIGRFSAEFQSCFSAFGGNSSSGTWTLLGLDGVILESGVFEDGYLSSPSSVPFFRAVTGAGSSKAYYAKFGEARLFTATRPVAETKQTFLAEPAKE
ncbi:MAG: hypothetical protein ACKO1H_16475 [Tabrizicola sp.]